MIALRRGRRALRRSLIVVVMLTVILAIAFWTAGYVMFYRSHEDPLRRADVIVVLGGEHDGREQYGIDLARRGYAPVVLLSDPYDRFDGKKPDPVMDRACASSTSTVQVICFRPDPSTTVGEAMFAAKLAREHGWSSMIVVSWRFHLVRARYIFEQCDAGTLIMRSVPREYPKSLAYWGFQYAYQFVGLTKAAVVGCHE
ncbi:YdcF family protein [Gordonia sp. NPDC003504]